MLIKNNTAMYTVIIIQERSSEE